MPSDCIDHGCKGYGLGYATAWLTVDGKRFTTTKHRKVFYETTGELPEVVRHTCDNPRCINPNHLVGGTHKDNMRDKVERNRQSRISYPGESNPHCKLTDEECAHIRAVYVKGSRQYGCAALAEYFGVGSSQIWRIVNGKQR
jgi:hypothetical protein